MKIVQDSSVSIAVAIIPFYIFDENGRNVKQDNYSVKTLQIKAIWIQKEVE